jgi:hypothetical protein
LEQTGSTARARELQYPRRLEDQIHFQELFPDLTGKEEPDTEEMAIVACLEFI